MCDAATMALESVPGNSLEGQRDRHAVPARSRGREHVRMTAAEVRGFLAEPHTMIVATHGASGFPHQVAMFYVMDGESPAFWSYRRAQKIVNIQRDPRVSCLVESGKNYQELVGVLLTGLARVTTDPEVIERTWRLLTEKYSGPVTPTDMANFQRQAGKRCVVTLEVTRVTSWDHHKLPPRRH
jgi:PPOX class probable F420-dependent enzyme